MLAVYFITLEKFGERLLHQELFRFSLSFKTKKNPIDCRKLFYLKIHQKQSGLDRDICGNFETP